MIWTDRSRSEGAGALHYYEAGCGPTLVLIHGVGLRAEAWAAMVPLLAPAFRVLCVDMPGHGHSPLLETQGLSGYVSRFADFAAALDGPVGLVGHSMGALIALEVAAAGTARFSGVVALNTVYRRTPEAAQAVAARAQALAEEQRTDPTDTLQRWFGNAPKGANTAAAQACKQWLTEGNHAGYAAAYRVFAQENGPNDTALARIDCPALFLTGAKDQNSTPEMSRNLARNCAHGTAETIADAAHMMPMTHPVQVAAQIEELFAKTECWSDRMAR